MAGVDPVKFEFDAKSISKSFISNRKNSNLLIELEKLLLSSDDSVVLESLEAVQDIFIHVLETKELCIDSEVIHSEKDAYEKYKLWLRHRYEDFKLHLLECVCHKNTAVQVLALDVLMKLLKSEGENPLKNIYDSKWHYPKDFFQVIVQTLLSEDENLSQLIMHFKKYVEFDDVKMFLLKSISFCFESKTSVVSDIFLQNVFIMLCLIEFPEKFQDKNSSEPSVNTLIKSNENQIPFTLKEKVFRKNFSSVWITFLKFKLPPVLYKKVLILLHKKVLPHLTNPLLLTDFLTDSYNIGGAVSLLALNGLFFLMKKYNLEYPDFYTKLYALFDASILNSKFKSRFFFLSDLFLSSTHLPAYLVAAFVKRLSRLSLTAPPNVLLMILPFIGNILIRHPTLKFMINHPEKKVVQSDPYIFEETDPAKSKALESSLWEIKTLQFHWHPDVTTKAKFINQQLPFMEWNLADVLELNINDLILKEIKKISEAPMSFDKPTGLFERKEDKMNELWSLL